MLPASSFETGPTSPGHENPPSANPRGRPLSQGSDKESRKSVPWPPGKRRIWRHGAVLHVAEGKATKLSLDYPALLANTALRVGPRT